MYLVVVWTVLVSRVCCSFCWTVHWFTSALLSTTGEAFALDGAGVLAIFSCSPSDLTSRRFVSGLCNHPMQCYVLVWMSYPSKAAVLLCLDLVSACTLDVSSLSWKCTLLWIVEYEFSVATVLSHQQLSATAGMYVKKCVAMLIVWLEAMY